MQFIESPNKYKGRNSALRLIVWHDMEAPESKTTAESIARYFQKPATKASAHLCVDQDSVVECVKPGDTAWHAPGANADGYGIELAGYARQTEKEWLDAASLAAFTNAAVAVAPVMKAHNIPARWLTDAQLRDGKSKGMTTHAQVSRVFKKSTHTDPGANFPADRVLAEVKAALNPVADHGGGGKGTSAPVEAKPQPQFTPGGDRILGMYDPLLTGNDVNGVRNALRMLPGNNDIAATGPYDRQLSDRIALFQKNRGIKERGVGELTWAALRLVVKEHAKPAAPAQLVVDGDLGPATTRRWQEVTKQPVTGELTKPFVDYLQKWLNGFGAGLARDGVIGPNTIRALQKYLGVKQDGVLGKSTVVALQTRLNAGSF